MNRIRKRTGMALAGLLVLLSACEKDLLPKNGGEKVAVIFSASSGGYEATNEGVRSSSAQSGRLLAETTTHIKNDMYLYAKLVEDTDIDADELRATNSPLIEGQAVHLEAYYVSSGLLAGAADYHANAAGVPVLDDPTLPLEVDPALGPYDFKAYSYYQSTDAISTTDIDPTTSDLIWGETLNQAIDETETGRTVTILLKHCFSKVRVKLSVGEISNATITGLGSVTIGGSETVNLDVEDGSLSLSGTAMAQTVGGWVDAAVGGQAVDVGEPFSETALWSEYCLSYASLVKVTIYNIKVTVGGTDYAYSVLSTSFTEALSPGRHYTLVVDLKQIIFASSNIYWDATLNSGTGGLRFLASGGSNYQGVFFLWGSLVGVSPYGGLSGGYVGSQVYVYSPNINDGTWTRALAQDHPLSLGSSMTGGDYTNRGENYLYDHPDFANYKGDICSYLSGRSGVPTGNWRMPNAAEFGVKADYSTNGWITVTVSGSTEVQQAGMGTTSDGRYYNATSVASPWFPVGGCRSNNVLASSNYGYFWSGTPASTTTAYNLYMGASAGISIDPNPRYALHYPVRCVKI